jgi:UrcA family protein
MQKSMIIAASLLATATLFAVTPGVAAAQASAQSATVSHADLDLATPEGQRRLERRIASAARKICGLDTQDTGTRMAPRDASACYRTALASVRERVAAAIESSRRGG